MNRAAFDRRTGRESLRRTGWHASDEAQQVVKPQLRHHRQPAVGNVLGYKPGYRTMITQVFVDGDKFLESDIVFGVTRHLVGSYRRHGAGETTPAPDVEGPWYTLDHTFVMSPGEAKRPLPPIK